jgi:hypothetical protein
MTAKFSFEFPKCSWQQFFPVEDPWSVQSLGCHKKIPQTAWLKQQKAFLAVLEAGNSRSGCQQ